MIIDSREPKAIIESLKSSSSTPPELQFLEVGDYLLPQGFAVERKKGRDFIGSICSKRLYNQLNGLNEYEHPILAIISENIWKDFYYTKNRYIHSIYIGTLTTIGAKYPKIRIVQFEDDNQFMDYLVSLEKKLLENKSSERPKPMFRKPESLQDRKENSLSAIDGVGIKSAQILLREFKSINNISNLSIETLQEVEKIGKKTAQNIYETLH